MTKTVWPEINSLDELIPDVRNGLVYLFKCDGVYTGWYEMVNQVRATDAGAALTDAPNFRPSVFGGYEGEYKSISNNYSVWLLDSQNMPVKADTEPFTCLSLHSKTTRNDTDTAAGMSERAAQVGWQTKTEQFFQTQDAGLTKWDADGAGNTGITYDTLETDNIESFLCVVMNPDGTTDCYTDEGEEHDTNSTGIVTGGGLDTFSIGAFFRASGVVDPQEGEIGPYVFVWDEAKSPAFIQRITRNPKSIVINRTKDFIYRSGYVATGAYTLTADSGSYTYTGTTTGLNKGSKVQADSGSYALTGTATGLKRGVKLPANSGSYSLTGQTVGLLKGYKLPADSGSYTLTGQDVTLTYNPASSTYTLTCDSGSYTLTGVSQAFLRTYVLDMESGAYTLTGSNVTLSYSSGIWEVQSDDNSTWSVKSNNSDTWTVQ